MNGFEVCSFKKRKSQESPMKRNSSQNSPWAHRCRLDLICDFLCSFFSGKLGTHFLRNYQSVLRKASTTHSFVFLGDHLYITSANFWPFWTPPTHLISINTVVNVSKSGPPSPCADVIYGWSHCKVHIF